MSGPSYGLSVVTRAKAAPLEVAKVRVDHLRSAIPDDDAYIQTLIATAAEYVEEHACVALMESTWRMRLDRFPTGTVPLVLPMANVTAVTEVAYTDPNGVAASWDLANVKLSADRSPPLLRPARGKSWPSAASEPDAVSITFTAGAAKVEDVPPVLVQAMLLLIGHWYENREAIVVGTITKEMERAVDALIGKFAYDFEFVEVGT